MRMLPLAAAELADAVAATPSTPAMASMPARILCLIVLPVEGRPEAAGVLRPVGRKLQSALA